MPSNFDFLRPKWADLHDDTLQVERQALAGPRTCAFYARRVLERMLLWLYANDGDLRPPYQENLAAMLHEPSFQGILPSGMFAQVRLIHKIGNLAVHSNKPIRQLDSLQVARMLHGFLAWVAGVYSSPSAVVPPFDDTLIPKPAAQAAADRSAEQLQKLQDELGHRDESLAEHRQKLQVSEEAVEALRRQVAELRAANEKVLTPEPINEAATRDLFIDVLLREAGWDPDGPNVAEYPVTGMPNTTGEGYVDYALWGEDNLPLAVVEAKRTRKDARQGKRQAELYADALERMTGQRPLIFYSNGYEHWFWDDKNYPPRAVQGFYTRDELQLLINRRTSQKDITKATIGRQIVERYYHEEAMRRVLESFGKDMRRALLVLATGTGKTRLSIALVDLLMKCNWVLRVLFLADRNALLTQAKRAFKKFLQNITPVDLTQEKENDDSRLVFSTYPTMMNCIDDERHDGRKRFGVGHFDLVIIDEAHRSVYQKYRAIFQYFDALLLGLTATPRAEVDRDTYGLFNLEQGVPTYSYELAQAVADEFLVPFKAVSVPTKFSRHGIKYDDLSDAEKEEYESSLTDPETGQMPPEIEPPALNKWLFNADTVDKVLAFLMERGLKIEGGDKLGKTIIFAKNHDHAEFIAERFDANYPHLAGKFCRVIDVQVKYAQSLIDDFYIPDKDPHIAVSVDMLDTGIDVPECVNLVFFKVVRSKVKFWQMVGRGTRLCPNLFGPGKDKKFFYLFDFCENLEFFGANEAGYEATLQEPLKQKIFRRRLSLAEKLAAHGGDTHVDTPAIGEPNVETADSVRERPATYRVRGLDSLRRDLLDQMHAEVTKMDVNNFLVRPHRRQVEKYAKRDAWEPLGPNDVHEIDEHLTALPTPDEDEEMARRFDLLLLNLQLAMLEGNHDQARYQVQVREIASGLEEKRNIPAVNVQMALILELQTDEYWQDITLPMLENVRKRLRDLVKFLDPKGGRDKVYSDFVDEIGSGTEVSGLVRADATFEELPAEGRAFLPRPHQSHHDSAPQDKPSDHRGRSAGAGSNPLFSGRTGKPRGVCRHVWNRSAPGKTGSPDRGPGAQRGQGSVR
jgi:type I restriction enzyme R subunit